MASTDIFDLIAQGDVESIRTVVADIPGVGRSMNAQGMSALMMALYHRRQDIVALLRPGAEPLNIHEAAALGDVSAILRAVEANTDAVNRMSADGFTPLHIACYFGNHDAALACLNHGADLHAVSANPSRLCPIHSAAAGGHREIIQLLLRNGADPNCVQHGGWTALHSAAGHGHVEMVRTLLDGGAHAHQASDDGKTPADMARERSHGQLAGWLEEL
ncbi:MAG: ankyrin repeat domain-containing protein [Phycisphaerales bacterium]|nr:ankyrin repeat domain-containing protein [Phycisphaerales bacterium]